MRKETPVQSSAPPPFSSVQSSIDSTYPDFDVVLPKPDLRFLKICHF